MNFNGVFSAQTFRQDVEIVHFMWSCRDRQGYQRLTIKLRSEIFPEIATGKTMGNSMRKILFRVADRAAGGALLGSRLQSVGGGA